GRASSGPVPHPCPWTLDEPASLRNLEEAVPDFGPAAAHGPRRRLLGPGFSSRAATFLGRLRRGARGGMGVGVGAGAQGGRGSRLFGAVGPGPGLVRGSHVALAFLGASAPAAGAAPSLEVPAGHPPRPSHRRRARPGAAGARARGGLRRSVRGGPEVLEE